jgi:hypothetical protein
MNFHPIPAIVSVKDSWLYQPIYKNATYSIYELLLNHYNKNIDNKSIHFVMYNLKENNDICLINKIVKIDTYSYKKFIVLRDPYKRFVSNFFHKLIQHPHQEVKDFLSVHKLSDNIITNFANFINFQYSLDEQNRDVHFQSQIRLGKISEVKYDYYLNINNLQEEWKQLTFMPPLIKEKRHRSGSSDFANYIKNDPINKRYYKKIAMMYEKDYEFLSKLPNFKNIL